MRVSAAWSNRPCKVQIFAALSSSRQGTLLLHQGMAELACRDGLCWVLIFLSALSPSLGKRPQMQHDWLDACLLVTCQNDFSDILVSPGGMNDFWKAAMSFPLSQQIPLGSDLDQLEINAQIFSQCCPLLGGNQTEDRNQLLQKNQTHRQKNPLYPHPLVHSHHQCWRVSVHKFWVLAWRKMWEQLQLI